jgi:hypothetical protein
MIREVSGVSIAKRVPNWPLESGPKRQCVWTATSGTPKVRAAWLDRLEKGSQGKGPREVSIHFSGD